jgi:hypothetical protein
LAAVAAALEAAAAALEAAAAALEAVAAVAVAAVGLSPVVAASRCSRCRPIPRHAVHGPSERRP